MLQGVVHKYFDLSTFNTTPYNGIVLTSLKTRSCTLGRNQQSVASVSPTIVNLVPMARKGHGNEVKGT